MSRGGPRPDRCPDCRLALSHCICALRPAVDSRAGFCLLMGSDEPFKPSNTGWLIADMVANTFAFGWSRTAADPALLALLADPVWQPYIVFPGELLEPGRELLAALPPGDLVLDDPQESVTIHASVRTLTFKSRRPLFILLDATWPEARKMFRKSPYLDCLPVLSLQTGQVPRYRLRQSNRVDHLCTAEVAALCLAQAGDTFAAQTLEAYLDVFIYNYLQAKQQRPVNLEDVAHLRLRKLLTMGASVL